MPGLFDDLPRLRIHFQIQILIVIRVEEKSEHHFLHGLGAVADGGGGVGVERVEGTVVEMGDGLDFCPLGEFLRPGLPAVVLLPAVMVGGNREKGFARAARRVGFPARDV